MAESLLQAEMEFQLQRGDEPFRRGHDAVMEKGVNREDEFKHTVRR